MNILAQAFGIVSMLLLFVTYQINDRLKMLVCHIAISICWTIHYGLLGAQSAMLINIICFVRNILFYFRGRWKWTNHPALPVAVCIAEAAATLFAWTGNVDMLALVGAPLQTAALWMKKPRGIRIFMLVASPLWLVYDALNGSYAGILTETIVMISIVSAMIRYDVGHKKIAK